MRFLLYNIRYATAKKRPRFPWSGYFSQTGTHLNQIVEFIREVDPDVAGLIEVDAGSFRTREAHQAEIMAEALGHYHSFESKYCDSTRVSSMPVLNKQGNAFLAKDSILREQFHYFTEGMKRLVIELELEDLTIFLVHLSLGFKTRHRQLAQLYSLIRGTDRPHIVAGDFNALWGEDEISLFLGATGLVDANTDSEATFPSWKPNRHLDFILHSPDIQVDKFLDSTGAIVGSPASRHRFRRRQRTRAGGGNRAGLIVLSTNVTHELVLLSLRLPPESERHSPYKYLSANPRIRSITLSFPIRTSIGTRSAPAVLPIAATRQGNMKAPILAPRDSAASLIDALIESTSQVPVCSRQSISASTTPATPSIPATLATASGS